MQSPAAIRWRFEVAVFDIELESTVAEVAAFHDLLAPIRHVRSLQHATPLANRSATRGGGALPDVQWRSPERLRDWNAERR
jgi:hypothetical protein